MIIIPAIDIIEKGVVRLYQGDFNQKTQYPCDPVETAFLWEKKGAEFLHIVDLDGAKTGEIKNGDIIGEVIKQVKIPCEVGGGLRTGDDVEYFLERGAKRVVFGTKAFEDTNYLENLVKEFGDKVVVSIDFSDGKVVKKGWQETTDLTPEIVLKMMEQIGVKTIVVTDIKTDGTLQGPNIEGLKNILNLTSMSVIASGGISCLDDVKSLKTIGAKNLEGVITGKALYDGKLNLEEAIRV